MIVLEGLRGKSGAQSCPAHEIRQAPYDQWRDQLVAHAAQAFASHQHTRRDAQLEHEHGRLKKLVGARTLAVKNSDEILG
jgi:hypothetical protein